MSKLIGKLIHTGAFDEFSASFSVTVAVFSNSAFFSGAFSSDFVPVGISFSPGRT